MASSNHPPTVHRFNHLKRVGAVEKGEDQAFIADHQRVRPRQGRHRRPLRQQAHTMRAAPRLPPMVRTNAPLPPTSRHTGQARKEKKSVTVRNPHAGNDSSLLMRENLRGRRRGSCRILLSLLAPSSFLTEGGRGAFQAVLFLIGGLFAATTQRVAVQRQDNNCR